jgi:hypothetical protein
LLICLQPPYVFGCIATVLSGYYSDKFGKRAVYVSCEFLLGFADHSRFLTGEICIALVGYILLISSNVPAAQYIGTFLAACGVYVFPDVVGIFFGGH